MLKVHPLVLLIVCTPHIAHHLYRLITCNVYIYIIYMHTQIDSFHSASASSSDWYRSLLGVFCIFVFQTISLFFGISTFESPHRDDKRLIFIICIVNSLRPRLNRRRFADDIFKCIFLNENEWISIKISLKFVPKGPINKIPALVQIMAWHRPGDKPLSEPMLISLPTHICVTRPQWVKVQFLPRPPLLI